MSAERYPGREFAGRGRGGRGPPPPSTKRGPIPSIGVYLSVPTGKILSAAEATLWSHKLGEYSMSIFTSRIHNIFGENWSTGLYPVREELEDPEDDNRVEFEEWKVAFVANSHFSEKLEAENT